MRKNNKLPNNYEWSISDENNNNNNNNTIEFDEKDDTGSSESDMNFWFQ